LQTSGVDPPHTLRLFHKRKPESTETLRLKKEESLLAIVEERLHSVERTAFAFCRSVVAEKPLFQEISNLLMTRLNSP
jgi:hypothetical protein